MVGIFQFVLDHFDIYLGQSIRIRFVLSHRQYSIHSLHLLSQHIVAILQLFNMRSLLRRTLPLSHLTRIQSPILLRVHIPRRPSYIGFQKLILLTINGRFLISITAMLGSNSTPTPKRLILNSYPHVLPRHLSYIIIRQ